MIIVLPTLLTTAIYIIVLYRVDRVASEEVTVSGMKIPKGHIVGIEIYALHHDPTVWPDPDKFDPER